MLRSECNDWSVILPNGKHIISLTLKQAVEVVKLKNGTIYQLDYGNTYTYKYSRKHEVDAAR